MYFFRLFILINLLAYRAHGQQADCHRMLDLARELVKLNKYEMAIKKLNAVSVYCPDSLKIVNLLLVKIYTEINSAKNAEFRARKTAEIEKKNAIQQARISEAARLAAESRSILTNYPASIAESARLAINSMRLYPSLQADEAIRNVLQIIAPLDYTIHFDVAPDHVVVTNNWVVLGGFDAKGLTDVLCIIDLNSKKIKQTIRCENHYTISQIVISADSQFMGVGLTEPFGPTSRVEIRSIATGDVVFYKNLPGYYKKLAITSDNKTIAIASGEKFVQLFNIATGELFNTISYPRTYNLSIKQLSFNFNNQYVCIDDSHSLEIWKDWEKTLPINIFKFTVPSEGFFGIETRLLTDRPYFAIAKPDSVLLFHWDNLKLDKVFFIPGIHAIKFLKDNRMLTHSSDNSIGIWAISACKLLHRFHIGKNRLLNEELLIDPTEKFLLTVNRDDGKTSSIATFWDLYNGSETSRMYHSSYIQAIYSLGGTAAITIGKDHEIRRWRNRLDTELNYKFKSSISSYSVSTDQTKLVVVTSKINSKNGEIVVFNNVNRSLITRIPTHEPILSIGFSKDNNDILLFTSRALQCWQDWIKPGRGIKTLYSLPDSLRRTFKTATIHNTGTQCVSIDGKGKIYLFKALLWSNPTIISYSNLAYPFDLDVSDEGIAINKSGDQIALGLTGGIALINVTKKQQIKFINQDYTINKLAFLTTRNCLIFISGIKYKETFKIAVYLYNLNSKEKAIYPLETDGFIGSIAIHNSRKLIAIANGKFARIYELPQYSGKPLLTHSVIEREGTINQCDFSPNGKFLITARKDIFETEDQLLFSYVYSEDLVQALIDHLGSLWVD